MWELWGGRNFGLPIDFAHHLYNSLLLSQKPWLLSPETDTFVEYIMWGSHHS